jgi:hypothetical protein
MGEPDEAEFGPDEVESGPDEVEFGPVRSRRRRPVRSGRLRPARSWMLAAAVLAAAVAVIAVRVVVLLSTPSRAAVSVTLTGRRLLGVRGSWELFAHGPRDLVAIDLARGQITTTVLPAEVTGAPQVSFLVGPHEAIIQSGTGSEPGYVIPDGAPARPLAGRLGGVGPLLPGPKSGEAWQYSWSAGSPVMTLVTLTGRPAGPAIALTPPHHPAPGMPAADGQGGVLLLGSPDEVLDAWPDRRDQVNGQVIAVGPTRWLLVSCRDAARCRNLVYDPRSGALRALPGPAVADAAYIWPPDGVVSPDGAAAAVIDTGTAPPTIRLINLVTGTDSPIFVPFPRDARSQSMAWSPDSRWLFLADNGRLLAVNAGTGRVTGLGLRLPEITQVAVRPGPG